MDAAGRKPYAVVGVVTADGVPLMGREIFDETGKNVSPDFHIYAADEEMLAALRTATKYHAGFLFEVGTFAALKDILAGSHYCVIDFARFREIAYERGLRIV